VCLTIVPYSPWELICVFQLVMCTVCLTIVPYSPWELICVFQLVMCTMYLTIVPYSPWELICVFQLVMCTVCVTIVPYSPWELICVFQRVMCTVCLTGCTTCCSRCACSPGKAWMATSTGSLSTRCTWSLENTDWLALYTCSKVRTSVVQFHSLSLHSIMQGLTYFYFDILLEFF